MRAHAKGAIIMAFENPDEVELSSLQRIKLKLFGYFLAGTIRKQGWKAEIPQYAFRCKIHGIVRNTPQGHGHLLLCPLCLRDKMSSTSTEDLVSDISDQIQFKVPEH